MVQLVIPDACTLSTAWFTVYCTLYFHCTVYCPVSTVLFSDRGFKSTVPCPPSTVQRLLFTPLNFVR